MLRVGTFLPPATRDRRAVPAHPEGGKIPPDDHALFMKLLRDLTDVEFVHDLDIRRSFVRDGTVYCGEVRLNDLDLYLWHAEVDRDPGSYALEALRTLGLDVPVVPDPARFATSLDKYRAHLRLSRAGLPVPDTILLDRRAPEAAAPVVAQWGRALLKPRRGSFGQGVLLIEDFATLRDLADYLEHTLAAATESTFLLERFRKRGHRFTRLSADASKVYALEGIGGDVDACEVPPEHSRLARRAQRALDLSLVGFDLILAGGRPVIVDENTYPGLYPELFAAAGRSLSQEHLALVRDAISDRCGGRGGPTDPEAGR